MIWNASETDEKKYLSAVTAQLQQAVQELETKIAAAHHDIVDTKAYMWANRDQLDPAERAANLVDLSLAIDFGEKAVHKLSKLRKLAQSPYFGRVDFRADEDSRAEAEPFYIGLHAFSTAERQDNVIYDWRSPIAGLF